MIMSIKVQDAFKPVLIEFKEDSDTPAIPIPGIDIDK